MNKQRLSDAADWAEKNIPPEMFDIEFTRKGDKESPVCNTIGCMVGHLTAIDADNVSENYTVKKLSINFMDWSQDYFDIDDIEWYYLFSAKWAKQDGTLNGAIERMRSLANGMTDDEIALEIKKITK